MAEGKTYEFGDYRLDVPLRRLLRGVQPVALTPKAFDMLLALIERRDRVVEKIELMQLVWPDSFVEESNLSQTVFVLRKTLGADPQGRQYIDTVPRRGYRFAADVRNGHEGRQERAAVEPARGRPAAVAAAAVVLIVVVAATWYGALRIRSSGRPASRIESLVVLPLQNLSGDAEQDYLADGMTDALITNLGQISGLRVISRTSAMTYKGTHKALPAIARELHVDAAVEGTIQRSAGRLRLNLKLIEASTDRSMWAQSYERDLQESLDLQNEVARAIASRIEVALTAPERARFAEAPRVNAKVYDAYLQGRYFWNRRGEADVRKAIERFEDALRHDPGYAPAYAGLADSYVILGASGWKTAAGDPWTLAIGAADRAVALDDRLADGHTSRAAIAMAHELDWPKAEQGFRRALELNPGYATARHWYGYYLMLMGRLREAEAEFRRALELDPLSPIINANIGFCLYVGRHYDAALAHLRTALEMHPNHRMIRGYIVIAQVAKEQYAEAAAELEKKLQETNAEASDLAVLAHTYARMGRKDEARTLLSRLLAMSNGARVPAYYIALVYVGLGDHDRALEWLEKANAERTGPFNEVNADPMFDALRPDPRFANLLHRMGLSASEAPPSSQ